MLTSVAHASKQSWGYPPALIAQWRDALTLTPEFVERHRVTLAEDANGVVGFYALAREGADWQLEHLWITPDAMGRGLGHRLLRQAVAEVRAAGAGAIFIDADPNAEGFYLRMGAERIGTTPGAPTEGGRSLPRLRIEPGTEDIPGHHRPESSGGTPS